jgi:hypothetical protein
MLRGPPVARAAVALVAAGFLAGAWATAGQSFAIDKSHTFLGWLSLHGEAPGGVHEPITARAIRRGMPEASSALVAQIQAGAENVDVLHHFDAEYHFDSASISSPVREQQERFRTAFATVHSHLKGAEPLADGNPEFFDPSFGSYRAIAASLAGALGRLAVRRDCGGCSRARVVARAAAVTAVLPHLTLNKYPDPHAPTNPDSMFAFNLPTAKCGLCGLLWPANKVSREFQKVVVNASAFALAQSAGLEAADPLRRSIVQVADALRAYRAFQALGHAFHATQDFFAHSNYVELMAGVEVEQPIREGTRIQVPQRRGDFNLEGLRRLMGPDRFAKLETGSAAAIWLGEGDYCLGSPYNPPTRIVLFRIPAAVAKLFGLPREVATPGGKNIAPPRGLNYCHYPSKVVNGLRASGLNKDEPGRKEPSHVNHAFAVQAAEDMTAVLWKSVLAAVSRPAGDTPTAKPKPKPKPKPAPAPGAAFEWVLAKTEIDPLKQPSPPHAKVTARSGHIDYDWTGAPQTEFDTDFNQPPARVKPGAAITFDVTIAGRLTGGLETQGFRTADAIFIVGDRWVDTATALGQNCYDPIGTAPIACTDPATAKGSVSYTTPTSGTTFTVGIGLLNCGTCYVRYTYAARG